MFLKAFYWRDWIPCFLTRALSPYWIFSASIIMKKCGIINASPIIENNVYWTSPALAGADRKGTILHQVKYVVDVVVHPEEGEKDENHGEVDWKWWMMCVWHVDTCSSYRLLIWMLCLFKASSIMAMWLRYSVMAVRDKHLVSRNTKSCTSPTLSLMINMRAMAAYGLGPWRSDGDDAKIFSKDPRTTRKLITSVFICGRQTSIPRLKHFWISGIRNLMDASAWGNRLCFLTHCRTSSGLTRSPTLCWAIKLNKTHTQTELVWQWTLKSVPGFLYFILLSHHIIISDL